MTPGQRLGSVPVFSSLEWRVLCWLQCAPSDGTQYPSMGGCGALCLPHALHPQKYPEHAIYKVLQLMLRRGEVQHRLQRKVLYRLK